MIDLTEEQIERYSRHILLQDVGLEGQEKLLNAKVLIVGAGGLGSPVALYLAAAGVGHIGIVDADVVDLSNLQRQVIHQTKDLGTSKVESAKEKMIAINPDVEVTTYHDFLDSHNAEEIIKPWDFVIDGTDNFPVKFLINDACVRPGKAFSHGGILRFQGRLLLTCQVRHVTAASSRNHLQQALFLLVVRLVFREPSLVCWEPSRLPKH